MMGSGDVESYGVGLSLNPEPYRMQFEKALQATALMVRLHGNRTKYFRVLKLLYIADRESLLETGYPITTDRFVAMKYGPLLSGLYNYVSGEYEGEQADRFAECFQIDQYDIVLKKDTGAGKLARYEVQKLQEVFKKYENVPWNKLIDITHEFPEWKKNDPGASSQTIPVPHVLENLGNPAKQEHILNRLMSHAAAKRLLQG